VNRNAKEWYRAMQYDLETAELLLEKKRLIYVVFLSVQMVEKALKALWVDTRDNYPPKTHNLIRLSKLLGVWSKFTRDQRRFVAFINPLYNAIRYPDAHAAVEDSLDEAVANEILDEAKEVCRWIEDQLS
jgi:HEPN domain-containing protein